MAPSFPQLNLWTYLGLLCLGRDTGQCTWSLQPRGVCKLSTSCCGTGADDQGWMWLPLTSCRTGGGAIALPLPICSLLLPGVINAA